MRNINEYSSKVSGYTHTKEQLDNYANQNNPNSSEYKANLNNYANQLNPNNDKYAKKNKKIDSKY